MIYTISQHKVNTQCLNEYSKSLKEVKLCMGLLSLNNHKKNNLIKKSLAKSFLPRDAKPHSKPRANRPINISYRDCLGSLKLLINSQATAKEQPTFSSNNQTSVQLLTSPFVLQSYSKVRSKILRKLQHSNLALHSQSGSKSCSLTHVNRGSAHYSQTSPVAAVTGGQLQSGDLFSGVLLFSREDLAFINLRSLLSTLLKALHVCLFATLNNKRILFVGDPQPLVQEHHQRLLSCFIGSQIKTFSTKMTELLPPLPPSLGKIGSLSFADHSKRDGVNSINYDKKLAANTDLHRGPIVNFAWDAQLRQRLRELRHLFPQGKPLASITSQVHIPCKVRPPQIAGKAAKNYGPKYQLFSNLHALVKFRMGCKAANPESLHGILISGKSAPNHSLTAGKVRQAFEHDKSFKKLLSEQGCAFHSQLFLAARSLDKPKATNHGLHQQVAEQQATRLRPISNAVNIASPSFVKAGPETPCLLSELGSCKISKNLQVTNPGPSEQKLHDKLLQKVQKATLKTTLTFRLNKLQPEAENTQYSVDGFERSVNENNQATLPRGQRSDVPSATPAPWARSAAKRQTTAEAKGSEASHDYFFYTGMAKLISKAAIRNSQWAASLAQPTNYWIGGFFSNNLATYKQKLSSTTLLNIKMDPESQLQDFQYIYCENSFSRLPENLLGPLTQSASVNGQTALRARLDSQAAASGQRVAGKKGNKVAGDKATLAARTKLSRENGVTDSSTWAVTKTGELFFDKSFFSVSSNSKHLLNSVGDSSAGLWNAIYTPVTRKSLSDNLGDLPVNYFQRKRVLKSFRGQIPTKIKLFKKRKDKFHKKVINHCLHSIEANKATNAWLKEADLVFFANPEKTLSLLNQMNRLKIPTLGIINSGSNLAFPFRSVKGSSLLSAKPTINYPIMGNSNSLNFLRIVLTKFACVLNKKRV